MALKRNQFANTGFLSLVLATLIFLASLFAFKLNIDEYNAQKVQAPTHEKIAKSIVLGVGAEGWTAIFTGVLAAFTIALAITTFRLFQVSKKGLADTESLTRQSLDHSNRSAKAAEEAIANANRSSAMQLRAYVGIRNLFVSNRDAQGNPVEVTVVIENFGDTPALRYSIRVGWTDERRAFGRDAADLPFRGNPSTLMPGQTDETALCQPRVPISFGIVFGRIDYEDAFGEPRFTNFRYRSRMGTDRFTPDTIGNDSN